MPFPHDMFLGCPSAVFVLSSSGQISLPQCIMNSLSSHGETYREYSLGGATDDLLRFWRSGTQQAVQVAKASVSMQGASKSIQCRDVPDIQFRLARYPAVFQHPDPAPAEKQ